MKVINSGNSYEIYDDNLQTFDQLPAKTYKVTFNPMTGYSLISVSDFETTEPIIYGDRMKKIDKVFNAFDHTNRSLGVILSGDKGIGKSLFTQILSTEANKKNLPVILVTNAYPGIADFLDTIEQECLILFDEFDKVFTSKENEKNSQNQLLSLFDGLSQQKRIYAITINKLYNVSEFMINRPGRFHYHFRFEYPNAQEITTYMTDKLGKEYHSQIPKVVSFSRKMSLNYDCLRAIATELNFGSSFSEAIQDLNILNVENKRYDVECEIPNLPRLKISPALDMFADQIKFEIDTIDEIELTFTLQTSKAITVGESLVYEPDTIQLSARTYLDDDDDDYERVTELCKTLECQQIVITPQKVKTYGFNAN